MDSKVHQKIELVANISIILVAILLVFFLAQKFLISSPPHSSPSKEIAKSTKINLPNTNWQENKKTVLLVLQKNCGFCTSSMPFYNSLVQKASEKNIKVIAVLPDSTDESSQYLNEHGINVFQIKQMSLSSIEVKGTPTLILVNERGEVTNSWIGKLSPEREREVISQL